MQLVQIFVAKLIQNSINNIEEEKQAKILMKETMILSYFS